MGLNQHFFQTAQNSAIESLSWLSRFFGGHAEYGHTNAGLVDRDENTNEFRVAVDASST